MNQPPPNQLPSPADQSRRWLPAAIIGTAIIVAGAVIGGAIIIINSGSSTDTAASSSPSASTSADPSAPVSVADSSTCEAWPVTNTALKSIPALPAGWDWETPGIDALIANQNAAIETSLELFEGDIAESDPPEVVAAASEYVAAQRLSIQQFTDHTYTGAGAAVTKARVKLDHACGVK